MALIRSIIHRAGFFFEYHAPIHIGLGAVAGLWLGLNPPLTLHYFFFLILFACLRLNLFVAVLSFGASLLCASFFEPFFHALGSRLLSAPDLAPLWRWLYNAPLLAFCRFTHTQVLGSFLVSLVLSPLAYGLGSGSLMRLENPVSRWMWNNPAWKWLMGTRLFRALQETPPQQND